MHTNVASEPAWLPVTWIRKMWRWRIAGALLPPAHHEAAKEDLFLMADRVIVVVAETD